MSLALRRIEGESNYCSVREHDEKLFQDRTIRIKEVFQRELENTRQLRKAFLCNALHSCCYGTWNLIRNSHLADRIYNHAAWITGRFKEAANKANEIPYFLSHPSLIIRLYHRQRVKDAMTNLEPVQIKTHLSQILPAHPIEGNGPAMRKNEERVLALRGHKPQFTALFDLNRPISKEFIEDLMPSTSPIKLAYDNTRGKCIAFSGNSRLIALKIFCSEEFAGYDPEIETPVYHVDPILVANGIHFS